MFDAMKEILVSEKEFTATNYLFNNLKQNRSIL